MCFLGDIWNGGKSDMRIFTFASSCDRVFMECFLERSDAGMES
jgi:hypothetical protein